MIVRVVALLLLVCGTGAHAQRSTQPRPEFSAKGQLILPVPVGNDLFNDVTETIGQFDLQLQMPLFNGLGIGAGAKASFFTLDERALASAVHGDVTRWTWYGKLQYEHFTSERTFYELAVKAGSSLYRWNASTCPEVATDHAGFWGATASYYLLATDNLAFGLLLGYETDDVGVGPETFCLESFPGRTSTGKESPISYLTIGLCFHTLFKAAPDRPLEGF